MGSMSQRDSEQWVETPMYSYTKLIDPYYSSKFKVMRHIDNPAYEMELYDLCFNSAAEFRAYFEVYLWRRECKSTVAVRHIRQLTRKDMCIILHEAIICLQRVPIRLSEIVEMPVEESAYAINCCLEAYSAIFRKTGYFRVDLDMICINRESRIKVWLNRNLSKSHPDFSLIDQNRTETDFIARILQIIEEITDYENTRKFSTYLLSNKIQLKFNNYCTHLSNYLKDEGIEIARSMKTIQLFFKRGQQVLYGADDSEPQLNGRGFPKIRSLPIAPLKSTELIQKSLRKGNGFSEKTDRSEKFIRAPTHREVTKAWYGQNKTTSQMNHPLVSLKFMNSSQQMPKDQKKLQDSYERQQIVNARNAEGVYIASFSHSGREMEGWNSTM